MNCREKCVNRGKVYGLSQESFCEHCTRSDSWKKDLYYVRPIPVALYSCHYCAGECVWLPEDLWWSELDKAWVCDTCWFDRDSNWDGENYIENSRGISLAAEIKRRT